MDKPESHSNDLYSQKSFVLEGNAQGTTYTIKYISSDSIVVKSEIDSLLNRIDQSLSLYNSQSLISLFNKSAVGIKYDHHLFNVVSHAIQTYGLSKGAFDITCKPLSLLWGFGKEANSLPSKEKIITALLSVGSNKLIFRNDSLIKLLPNVLIDCDGIAQGYSVDVIFDFLHHKGLSNFMVELGGEIRTAGFNLSQLPWVIGIENPNLNYDNEYMVTKKVAISNNAITTSGSYRKFKKIGEHYFSHIIDPIQGHPVNNGVISVSVIAKDAITADALDNAFMVLGIQKSFELQKNMPNVGIFILYQKKDGTIADTANAVFKSYLK
jgi:thiamine biosynthesis lipoprotein